RPPCACPRAPAGPLRFALAQYRLHAEHRGCARRKRARHSRQADRRLPAAVRGAAGARSRAQRAHSPGAGWRRCRRRRASARGRTPVAASGHARRVRCRRTVVRPRLRRSRHPAELSGGVPLTLPRHSGRARDRRCHRYACHRRRGRTTHPRGLRADRSGRDSLDHASSTGAPARWLAKAELPLDARGFLRVDATLRVAGHDDVFAAGDTIAFSGRDLPKSGVYAVRAGPALADNIRRAVTGRPLRRFRPQRQALYLVSTGARPAVGARNGLVVEGAWGWRWKGWVDRRLMRQYNDLPGMPPAAAALPPLADRKALEEISAIAMRCGGCGAKVGATVLSRALAGIEPAARADVVVGLDAPDDAALVDVGGEQLSLQTVDYFRAIVDDPYTLGKIAANHSLGDVYAMGGEPQTALAIATVPYGLESKVEADLSAMMAGANEVLREAGCALVGGHTSEGAELALGFAVNGLV